MIPVRLVLLLSAIAILGAVAADEKDGKKEPAAKKKGTVVGALAAKGPNWIEVKADGEEKARRYVPHWRGGAPAAGGGPDKEMVAVFKKLVIGSRVRVEWVFEERARAVKVEVLKTPKPKEGGK